MIYFAGVAKPAILAAAFTAVAMEVPLLGESPANAVSCVLVYSRRRRAGGRPRRAARGRGGTTPDFRPIFVGHCCGACVGSAREPPMLVSLARSLLSHQRPRVQPGLPSTSGAQKSIMGAQRVGSHTVQLPTDNIKRRPSHIYIAPQVPAQPHARPTTRFVLRNTQTCPTDVDRTDRRRRLAHDGRDAQPWRSHVRLPQGDDTQSARRHSKGRAFIEPAPEDKEQDRAQVVA